MDRLARAIVGVAAILQLTGCTLPLSTDFGLYKTNDYVSDETLKQIKNQGLTPLQVSSWLGEPESIVGGGKAIGYLQCATWSVKCMDVVIAVPAGVRQCWEKHCRQVGIWFDDSDRAVDTKSFDWDERLQDCSLELWLSQHAEMNCYSQPKDFQPEREPTDPTAGDLALVAPGIRRAGVFSVQQGDTLFFGRVSDSYVDWHKMLRLEPGRYTVTYYYADPRGPLLRTDAIELEAGHKYVVGSAYCSSWTRERGCSSGVSLSMRRETNATFLWLQDATTGQIVGGSKIEPEFTEP